MTCANLSQVMRASSFNIHIAMKLQNITLALFADATATCDKTVEINENCFIFALLFYSLFVSRDTVVDAICTYRRPQLVLDGVRHNGRFMRQQWYCDVIDCMCSVIVHG
jgi:hypothetical protein